MKAVVFDLDDTLLHDDLTISGFSVRVFRKLHEKGVFVIAASGRAQLSMKPYVDQLGCVDAYIACNGAEIRDGSTHRLIRQEMIPQDTATEIARYGERYGVYMHVYEGNRFFFNHGGIYADRYAASSKLSGICVGRLSDYIRESRNKILMVDRESRISRMYKEAVSLFDGRANITRSKPFYLEFTPAGTDKGTALGTVASILGISTQDMIAFGDSPNDLSMFRAAGKAVAVSNGWAEILACCDAVCGSNEQDGPARYLNDHFLNGEVLT